ncbi:hypothetical protein CPB85DRAFT_1278075 [Mucidula mucida]|nr:hypothetical protein CPB85DRAFT_1278075 [Mucidula mucida]
MDPPCRPTRLLVFLSMFSSWDVIDLAGAFSSCRDLTLHRHDCELWIACSSRGVNSAEFRRCFTTTRNECKVSGLAASPIIPFLRADNVPCCTERLNISSPSVVPAFRLLSS